MKWWGFGLVIAAIIVCGVGTRADAMSLQLQPLDIKTTLKKGENQKGYLDIANSGAETIKIRTSVQAFRQINSKGDLQFYDDEKVSAGILLDESEITLGPREVFRMYYSLSGAKLPEGDISATIFFTTESTEAGGITPAVRVGTLFHIVNGTPGSRSAEITQFSVPFFQLSGKVSGTYVVKNTSDPTKGGGFFPDVSIGISPLNQQQTITSSLVFPGVERENQFDVSTGRFGFYYVEARFGDSKHGQWVFIASLWQLFAAAAIILTGLYLWLWRHLGRESHTRHK